EGLRVEQLDGLGASGAGDRVVIEVLERADGRGTDSRIVLDQKDAGAGNVGVGGVAAVGMEADGGRGFGPRKVDRDRRAAAKLAVDPDLAAGFVGKAEDLAQAKAGALADRLGGEERLERA